MRRPSSSGTKLSPLQQPPRFVEHEARVHERFVAMSCHLVKSSPSRVYTLLAFARYNQFMVRHVDAIFRQGAFRPLEPLALPEGTRVHLSVEEKTNASAGLPAAKIHTPKLAHPEDAADFVMDVREAGNASSPLHVEAGETS